MSFSTKIEFSMVKGKTNNLKNHIINTPKKFMPALLKGSLIYGANASGKSNFIKAVYFAKQLIVKGNNMDQSLNVNTFKLSSERLPTIFEFDFIVDEIIYSYGFNIDKGIIKEEWLKKILATTEKTIFYRKTKSNREASIEFNNNFSNKKEKGLFNFILKGTRPNQLFLTETINRNQTKYENIYNWFKYSLVVIFPNMEFIDLPGYCSKAQMKERMEKIIKKVDIGIDKIHIKKINLEKDNHSIPREKLDEIKTKIITNERYELTNGNERITVYKENNQLFGDVLNFCHKNILFDYSEESDGTKRALDIVPILTEPSEKDSKVFLVDEINRSLHPHLTSFIFNMFYSEENTNQIIATTHETDLLNLNLFRRDEIWFMKKNYNGASELYSLEEFKPRNDKDIENAYLSGRYEAIPNIQNFSKVK